MAELGGLTADPAAMRRGRSVMLSAVNALDEMAKPTIGLIEAKLGLIPDLGGSSRLPAAVGLGRPKDIVMTARPAHADEALRIGFENRVASPDGIDAATAELVDELLANAPIAVGLAKRLLDAAAKRCWPPNRCWPPRWCRPPRWRWRSPRKTCAHR